MSAMSALSIAGCIRAMALMAGCCAGAAQAHLMVAQRGTLNIVAAPASSAHSAGSAATSGTDTAGSAGAFLVLSIPVSALQGVDDDHDGLLSATELQRHAARIERQLRAQVQLLGNAGALPLRGLMLQLSPPDETPGAPAAQLVMLGRFALGTLGAPGAALHLNIGLQGQHAGEQRFDVFVTRQDHGASHAFRPTPAQHLVIEPKRQTQAVLPTAWQRWVQRLQSWLRGQWGQKGQRGTMQA